jgi:hypothetical protein
MIWYVRTISLAAAEPLLPPVATDYSRIHGTEFITII